MTNVHPFWDQWIAQTIKNTNALLLLNNIIPRNILTLTLIPVLDKNNTYC